MYVVSKQVDWIEFSCSQYCTANTKHKVNGIVAQLTEQRVPGKWVPGNDVIKNKRIADLTNQQCSYLGKITGDVFNQLSSSC
jgi:hypothetical protein